MGKKKCNFTGLDDCKDCQLPRCPYVDYSEEDQKDMNKNCCNECDLPDEESILMKIIYENQ